MKYILTRMAIATIVFYLIGVFIAGSFDISNMHNGAKFFMFMFYAIFFFGVWMSESELGD